MSDETKNSASHPLVLIAGSCAGASAGIVAIALFLLHSISDAGMWAVAFMAACPSAMGCVIAYFMCHQPRQESPSGKV
jgi:hypothetical protein